MKTQSIRLLDVWVLGPFSVWAALQPKLPTWARFALGTYGLTTISYNLNNYLENKRRGQST